MHPLIPAALLCIVAPCLALETTPFTVKLKDPVFEGGVLSTNQGGLIISPELRIQARHLTYIHQEENGAQIRRVIAEGDLALIYKNQIYLGRRLEYDFINQTGEIDQGVTSLSFWFLGGEKIRINSDKSFEVSHAFLTTDDSKKMDWKVESKQLSVDQSSVLRSENITLRMWNVPIFWFPHLTVNLLDIAKKSPISFRFDWDKGFWPMLSVDYLFYSRARSYSSLRLSAHPSYGFGVALEAAHSSLDKRDIMEAKNYVGQKGFYYGSNPKKLRFRYRLQGFYTHRSPDNRSHLELSYDKLNDRTMESEFATSNFEMSKIRPTFVRIHHLQDKMILGLDARPKVNSFQTMKQGLPTSFCAFHPFMLGKTGIITTNAFRISYLDYSFAKNLETSLPDFSAARLETENQLVRSFRFKGVNIAALVCFNGIFYNKSHSRNHHWQSAFRYEMMAHWSANRAYSTFDHTAQPYVHYKGLSRPTMPTDTPYIFSIDDGFHRIEELKIGMRNFFYFKKYPLFEPNWFADIYCLAFLGNTPFKRGIPKIHAYFRWNFPSVALTSQIGWNLEKQTLDFTNVELAWTISEEIAIKTELRYRGLFDYRRSDRDNYLMEVARTPSELIHSPLSDQRTRRYWGNLN